MSNRKAQITIDVTDNPELRRAFNIAASQLEVKHKWLGQFFFGFGLWLTTKLSLVEAIKAPRYSEKHYPLLGILAAAIELKEMGFPKVRELERFAEEVKVFLESRRDVKK